VTTESAQLFVYIQRLESVAGPGQLDILILPIALPGGLVIPQVPWALYVPKPLDPALLGDYRYRGLLLDLRNTVFSDDAFVFPGSCPSRPLKKSRGLRAASSTPHRRRESSKNR
jgi:hypothetical protein